MKTVQDVISWLRDNRPENHATSVDTTLDDDGNSYHVISDCDAIGIRNGREYETGKPCNCGTLNKQSEFDAAIKILESVK